VSTFRFRDIRRFFTVKKYRCVYAAVVLHPVTGRVRIGYVGKDSDPPGRAHEHMLGGTSRCRNPQPWADTVVFWARLWGGRMTRFRLWWMEILFILLLRPIYNYEWNRWHRRRIKKWVAARRDRSAAYQLARVGYRGLPWRMRMLRKL
jgi:hypothetical protein